MASEDGHWVTLEDGRHIFIGGAVGEIPARVRSTTGKNRFARADIERSLIDNYERTGGGYTAHMEQQLEDAGGAGARAFTFHKQLPTEVKDFMQGRPALRGLFRVSDNAAHAGGADALGSLGDRYFDIAEAKAGSPLRAAVSEALGSNDPEVAFLAHVHSNLPTDGSLGTMQSVNAGGLRVGDNFTIGGSEYRVAEDSDGLRVLKSGRDYQVPADALTNVPVDKGSFRPGKRAKDVIPFSRSSVFYLHADAEAKPAITLGQGLPPTVNSLPAYYFWRPVIADGEYTHPTKGFRLSVDANRRKGWETNFRKMAEAGEKVPVVKDHADDKSDSTLGYVVDVRQNGAWLEELHQYLGDDARDVALRNQISVGIDPAYVTGKGVKLGDCIVHSATTPRPVVGGQGQAVPLAASRGGDILELSAAPTKDIDMDLTALRKAIGAADTVSDADVITQASTKLGSIPTLETAKTKAETDLAAVKVELSRTKPAEGDFPAAIATGSVNLLHREIELMAREGKITGEQATAAKTLIGTTDKPNTLMLSRTGADHPAEPWLKLLSLGKTDVTPDGKQKTSVQTLARQPHDHSEVMKLGRDNQTGAEVDRQAELLKQQLSGYGMATK